MENLNIILSSEWDNTNDERVNSVLGMDRRAEEDRRMTSNYEQNYTVIDFETCGTDAVNRKHITEVSALRVRQGQVVKEFSSLVNPGISIPEFVSKKTGITDLMVANAPTIDVILPEILEFIGNDLLMGYNISAFDIYVLFDVVSECLGKDVPNNFIDVMQMVKGIFHTQKCSLTAACKAFDIKTDGAHRALNDCYMTKNLYDALFSAYDYDDVSKKLDEANKEKTLKYITPNYTDTTLQLRKLQDILKEIIADGQVSIEEVEQLSNWMNENIELKGNYPFDRAYNLIEKVLADGVVDNDELSMLLQKFQEFTNPVGSSENTKIVFRNHHFVLTGDFDHGTRSEVEEYIRERNGIVDNTVKKCTNYVVVGSAGSDFWANGNYGTKVKKALELKDKGQPIEIITEKDFYNAGDSEDEFFEEEEWEQVTLFDALSENSEPWQDVVNKAIVQVLADVDIPENSVVLDTNYSRDGQKITSYSVCIRKPDYPKGINANGDIKTSLFNIQFAGHGNIVFCIEDFSRKVVLPEWNYEIRKRKSENFLRVVVSPVSADLYDFSRAVIEDSVKRYLRGGGGNSFGCCHLYKECSAAEICLHENKLYARGCQYYYNLIAGKIFY